MRSSFFQSKPMVSGEEARWGIVDWGIKNNDRGEKEVFCTSWGFKGGLAGETTGSPAGAETSVFVPAPPRVDKFYGIP